MSERRNVSKSVIPSPGRLKALNNSILKLKKPENARLLQHLYNNMASQRTKQVVQVVSAPVQPVSPVKYLAIPINSLIPADGKAVSVQIYYSQPPKSSSSSDLNHGSINSSAYHVDGPMLSSTEICSDPFICQAQKNDFMENEDQKADDEGDMDKEDGNEEKITFDEFTEMEEIQHSDLNEDFYHNFEGQPPVESTVDPAVNLTVIKRSSEGIQVPPKTSSSASNKRFRCTFPHCNKTFDRQRSLKYHSITHAPPIYACEVCKKAFVTMPKLKRHMLIHDGIRPFKCTEPGCGKGFTTNSNLNVHRRQHTGEKPFSCSVCGRQFAHHSHAKAHLKVHERRTDFR